MPTRQVISRARRTGFLVALAKGLPVTGAAAAAGVNRTLLYKWRARLPAFAAAWDDAVMTAIDLLEDEALRRALHGVERPVLYRGKQVGSVTTYNDPMLMLLLQRRTGRSSRGPERMPRYARNDSTSDRRESVSFCLPVADRQTSRAAIGTTAFQDRVNLSPSVSLSPPVIPGVVRNLFRARDGGVSDPREPVSFCLSVPDYQVSRTAIEAAAFRDSANLSPSASQAPCAFVVLSEAKDLAAVRPKTGSIGESPPPSFTDGTTAGSFASLRTTAKGNSANLSPSVAPGEP